MINRTYSYQNAIPPFFYQQYQQNNQNRQKNINNNNDSEDDSSDVVYLGHSGPIPPISPNEVINNSQSKVINQPDVEITKIIKPSNQPDVEESEIEKIIYNPEKLHSILSHLNGVNPKDPIFSEFYNHGNVS